jgi:hypothetical protein
LSKLDGESGVLSGELRSGEASMGEEMDTATGSEEQQTGWSKLSRLSDAGELLLSLQRTGYGRRGSGVALHSDLTR